MMTILDAIEDKHLFEPWFSRGTWENWRIFLSALFGLPLTSSQLAIFRECTGRSTPQTVAATEGWLICGRRSGKSFMLALVSVFLACFFDWQKYLAPGERGTIIIIAVNTRQARTIFRYVGALLKGVPMLARMIERETADSFDLNNSISVEVHTASFRSTRGYAVLAALLDEIAYFPTDDAAEPDREIINALKPGMAQFPNAMLLCASSPYAKRGSLFDAWRKHYGKDGDPILVWQAATRTMNPTISQRVIDEAMESDPASASAEYGAAFRADIESVFSRDAVEACVSLGVYERAPLNGGQLFLLCRS